MRSLACGPVAVLVATLAAALALVVPAAAQESRYTRSVPVAEPGWVGVPLSQETVQRSGTGLRLLGPGGEPVAFRRVPLPTTTGELPAVVVRVAPLAGAEAAGEGGAGRWAVILDLGTEPPRHDRLRLAVDRLPADPAVRIDASEDGADWRMLALAELMGRGAESAAENGAGSVARAELAYPATAARYLRLWWPPGAGAPELARVAARPVPPGAYELAATRPDCRPPVTAAGGTARVCRLGLGVFGRLLRRLDLDLESSGPVGYRLLRAEDGGWRTVAEGVVPHPGAEDRRLAVLDLGPAPLPVLDPAASSPTAADSSDAPAGATVAAATASAAAASDASPSSSSASLEAARVPLRLVLYAAGDEAPALVATTAVFEAEAIVFRATAAGRYTLLYGLDEGGRGREPGPPPPEPEVEEVRWLEPGPESAEPAAPGAGPPALLPAPEVPFAARFRVDAATAAAGDLVRLPLATEVYARTAPGLAGLRLLFGDSQVPYALWRSPEPVLVVDRPGASAGADGRISIDLEAAGLPLSALVLTAPGPRFEARVRLLAEADGEDGADEPEVVVDWTPWSCRSRVPLPCRLEVDLSASTVAGGAAPAAGRASAAADGAAVDLTARRLAIEIDGEAVPAAVDVAFWRRLDVLFYFQPAGDEPELVLAAGAPIEPPDYQLAEWLPELLERPWQPALLRVGPDPVVVRRLGRAALGVSLAAAIVLLLVLLDRMLRRRGA